MMFNMGYMKLSNHKSYRRCTSERDIFLKYAKQIYTVHFVYTPKRAKENRPYSSGSQIDWIEATQIKMCTLYSAV